MIDRKHVESVVNREHVESVIKLIESMQRM